MCYIHKSGVGNLIYHNESFCCFTIALAALDVVTADDSKNSSCPLWHYHRSENQPCVCGQELHGAIICSGDQVYLRVDYAMTWDSKSNDTLVAVSRYAYHRYSATHTYKRAYSLHSLSISVNNNISLYFTGLYNVCLV